MSPQIWILPFSILAKSLFTFQNILQLYVYIYALRVEHIQITIQERKQDILKKKLRQNIQG